MDRLLPAVVLVLAAVLTHRAHRQIDTIRFQDEANERIFLPSADALRVASMGYETITADLLWVRSVLTFVEIYEESRTEDVRWLDAMLTSVATLDPRWRTVYYHGGGMLRVCNAIDASDALFELGSINLPDEPYFPFSIGMNAYLYRQDKQRAAEYLDRAAKLPGAPPWYAAAAASFLHSDGGRQAALRYLKEQLEATSEPSVRRSLERKLAALLHEELVDHIAARREEIIAATGQDIADLSDLQSLPPDPLGGAWILAPDGVVRSSIADAALARQAVTDERWMLTVPWKRLE